MLLQIFDVEHGACSLLTADNNTRLMIDCGHNATTGWRPGTYLIQQGINSLDMLAITNYDEDHASGADDLLDKVYVTWLLRNASVSGATIRLLKRENGIGPGIERIADAIDNEDGFLELMKNDAFKQALRETNIYIASHHGRDNGCCDEIAACLQNVFYVVISDKGYQYDTQKTIPFYSRMAKGGPFGQEPVRKVLTTRCDGRIAFGFSPGSWGPR